MHSRLECSPPKKKHFSVLALLLLTVKSNSHQISLQNCFQNLTNLIQAILTAHLLHSQCYYLFSYSLPRSATSFSLSCPAMQNSPLVHLLCSLFLMLVPNLSLLLCSWCSPIMLLVILTLFKKSSMPNKVMLHIILIRV